MTEPVTSQVDHPIRPGMPGGFRLLLAKPRPNEVQTPRFSLSDQFLWEIIEFMVRWHPYGGPDEEDALPLFGMNLKDLRVRFAAVVCDFKAQCRLFLTERQTELLTKAQQIVSANAASECASTSPNNRHAIGLQPADGQWILRHGVWLWSSET